VAAGDGRAQLGVVGLVVGVGGGGQAGAQHCREDESFHIVSRVGGIGAMPCRPPIIGQPIVVVK
jgi:hypothetical protein